MHITTHYQIIFTLVPFEPVSNILYLIQNFNGDTYHKTIQAPYTSSTD